MYWSLGVDRPPEQWRHRLQWCWAHLKRDFQALIDSSDKQVTRLGHDLMRPTEELFAVWARYRDGTITRRGLMRLMKPIREEINSLLLRGVFNAAADTITMNIGAPPPAVPEPSTFAVTVLGLVSLGMLNWRRRSWKK
jgi:hypothetical protein